MGRKQCLYFIRLMINILLAWKSLLTGGIMQEQGT